MICEKCKMPIADNSAFCPHCGSKVEKKKQFCRECGSKIVDGASFCSKCGAPVEFPFEKQTENEPETEKWDTFGNEVPNADSTSGECRTNTGEYRSYTGKGDSQSGTYTRCDADTEYKREGSYGSTTDTRKDYGNYAAEEESYIHTTFIPFYKKVSDFCRDFWKKLDSFTKTAFVLMAFSLIVLVATLGCPVAELFSLMSVVCLLAAILAGYGKIRSIPGKLKHIILLVGVAFTVLSIIVMIFSGLFGTLTKKKDERKRQEAAEEVPQITYAIEKGSEYSYKYDKDYVYIANAVSDSIVTVEKWDCGFLSSSSLESTLGTYKINDRENGFEWIDDEHTAFYFNLTDPDETDLAGGNRVFFTLNMNDGTIDKGSNYDDSIACYKYRNDDDYYYRAVFLSESLVKMECRKTGFLSDDYMYDLAVINTENETSDFEWTDNLHTSFTITMSDPKNSGWQNAELTAFVADGTDYEYGNVLEYMKQKEYEKDKVKLTFSPDTFVGKKYSDVRDKILAMGFTNVRVTEDSTVMNSDDSEKTTSVRINGGTDYAEGDIFEKDVPIEIGYSVYSAPQKTDTETDAENKSSSSGTRSSRNASKTYSYSTNTGDTIKNGNSGIYSYVDSGIGSYECYYVIDFNEEYVYIFSVGNGDTTCNRIKIDYGDLNSRLVFTYHDEDGNPDFSWALYFKYKNIPDILVLDDGYGNYIEITTTNLEDALRIMNTRTMYDY